MYRGDPFTVLYVVVNKREIALLRRIIKEIDPTAFITITDVHEALGEGFAENVESLTL